MAAQPAAGTDERFATSVAEHFEAFLENFSSELPEGLDTSAADEPSPRDYVDQARGHPRGRIKGGSKVHLAAGCEGGDEIARYAANVVQRHHAASTRARTGET